MRNKKILDKRETRVIYFNPQNDDTRITERVCKSDHGTYSFTVICVFFCEKKEKEKKICRKINLKE